LQVGEVELAGLVQKHGATDLLVWLALDADDRNLSKNVVLLAKPRELDLQDPQLAAEVAGSDRDFTVTVSAKRPALWVWLDIPGAEARWSDNFVPLPADSSTAFKVNLDQPMTKADFIKALKVRSLFDTYTK
jgi:beta-mannosidase